MFARKWAPAECVITPPASIETVPNVALIAVAVPRASSIPLTCSVRSSAARLPISLRSRRAPTMTSAMFPACWPIRLPMGGPLFEASS